MIPEYLTRHLHLVLFLDPCDIRQSPRCHGFAVSLATLPNQSVPCGGYKHGGTHGGELLPRRLSGSMAQEDACLRLSVGQRPINTQVVTKCSRST